MQKMLSSSDYSLFAIPQGEDFVICLSCHSRPTVGGPAMAEALFYHYSKLLSYPHSIAEGLWD